MRHDEKYGEILEKIRVKKCSWILFIKLLVYYIFISKDHHRHIGSVGRAPHYLWRLG